MLWYNELKYDRDGVLLHSWLSIVVYGCQKSHRNVGRIGERKNESQQLASEAGDQNNLVSGFSNTLERISWDLRMWPQASIMAKEMMTCCIVGFL